MTSLNLVDSHCHLHDPEFFETAAADQAYQAACAAGVSRMLCVGTSLVDSQAAIEFSKHRPGNCWASVGIHPHEAEKFSGQQLNQTLAELAQLATAPEVRAIGECGFDFYYHDRSSVAAQRSLLEGQLAIAQQLNLPVSFHVREGFSELWPVVDNFPGLRGVLHSFTDREKQLELALSHDLLIGINGIATFTTHKWQRDLYKTIPLGNIILETDAPFLTPKPKRGNINTPENVIYITKFMAELRNESEESIALATTANAMKLFNLS